MTPENARVIMDSIEAAGVKYLGTIQGDVVVYNLERDIKNIIEYARNNGLINKYKNPTFKVTSTTYNTDLQVLPSNYDAIKVFYLSGLAVKGFATDSTDGYMTPDGYLFKPTHDWHAHDDFNNEDDTENVYKPDISDEPEEIDYIRDINGNRTESYSTAVIPQVLPEKTDKVYVEYSWEKEEQAIASLREAYQKGDSQMSSGNAPIKDEFDLPQVKMKSKQTRYEKIKAAKLQHEGAVQEAAQALQASYEADFRAQDLIKYVGECWDDYVEALSAARDDK